MFIKLDNGQIMKRTVTDTFIEDVHYCFEIEDVYDEEGNVIGKKKFNLENGEWEPLEESAQ